MREMTNEQRAKAAQAAVNAYAIAGEANLPHPAEILGDLLGDLRHWAAKVGVDFEQCDKNARICFENEVKEEADDAKF
jgi:hypothetical protein